MAYKIKPTKKEKEFLKQLGGDKDTKMYLLSLHRRKKRQEKYMEK
jgi:hypothetical protein